MPQILKANPSPRLISIIAPAYNEEHSLKTFVERVSHVMEASGYAYEIVFVNDGSTDATLPAMHHLRALNPYITIVNLSRNFGKEIAMTAGIAEASGDVQVIIDTDLQDPPEIIPEMISGYIEGYDVVYAQRTEREGETWLKKETARAFYRVASRIGPAPIPANVGDYRLISRRVAEALLQVREHHRFMKGLYAWVGFPQKAIPYVRQARHAGTTKWNYFKLWNLALEGITSFTIVPLKFATYVGFSISVLAFLYGSFIVVRTLLFGDAVQGFPTIMAVMLFLGGAQLIVLGLIGEYLGRVFNETKHRPLYLVESVVPSLSRDSDHRQVAMPSLKSKA